MLNLLLAQAKLLMLNAFLLLRVKNNKIHLFATLLTNNLCIIGFLSENDVANYVSACCSI